MLWLAVLATIASAILAALVGGRLDRRAGVAGSSFTNKKPSTAVCIWVAAIQVLTMPLLLLWLLSPRPAPAAELDPYVCFGGARYVAMSAGFRCADLPMFCAGARTLLDEAGGDEAAAERLARSRGHGRMAIALAHRFCRRMGS